MLKTRVEVVSLWVWDATEILDYPSFPSAAIWQTCKLLRLEINALHPLLCVVLLLLPL